MKKILSFVVALLICTFSVHAAYLRNVPVTLEQPDGAVVKCLASGDEFFNYLHDEDGYTIIQHPQTGYYMYAVEMNGEIVPSTMIVDRGNPAALGVEPHLTISAQAWEMRRTAWKQSLVRPDKNVLDNDENRNRGHINNLVIFIRFEDETNLTSSFSGVEAMFNDTTAHANSMYNFFQAASYNQLSISSSFYPEPQGNLILSYEDSHPRSYYMPYNASSNPNGYSTEDQRTQREHTLLGNAAEFVADSIPSSIDIDYNDDGYVDNICFVVKGNVGGWSDLLWPHRWALYTDEFMINNKIIWDYTFMLEGASGYFTTSVLSHEMQHVLSYPDLYHYSSGTNLNPVGPWDVMASTANPAQQSGAYTKWKYGNWVEQPVVIDEPGTYYVQSLGGDQEGPKAYAIPTENENEYIIIEYRDDSNDFENLPGTGVIIHRANTAFSGNADYNGTTEYDEVYIFRPGGTENSDGLINNATFGVNGRTEFSANTSPSPTFSNGDPITDIAITNITLLGDSASFQYNVDFCGILEDDFSITSTLTTSATFACALMDSAFVYEYVYDQYDVDNNPNSMTATLIETSEFPLTITNLESATAYQLWIRKVCSEDVSSNWIEIPFSTSCFDSAITEFPWTEGFENGLQCWSQEYEDGSVSWEMENESDNYDVAYEGNYFASFYVSDYDAFTTKLISPVLDITALESPVLSFYHIQPEWGDDQNKLKVYYRTAPSSDWVQIAYYTNNTPDWEMEELDLPNPSATYQIAFEAINDYGYALGVDQVEVAGTLAPCLPPTDVAVSDETENSITVTWNGEAEHYNVKYNELSSANSNTVATANNSVTLNNLVAGTIYEIQVQAVCNELESAWAPEPALQATTASSSIEENALGNVQLFPNPANSIITVSTENVVIEKVELIDMTGRIVKVSQMSSSIPIQELEHGLYFARVYTQNGEVTLRFVKQ